MISRQEPGGRRAGRCMSETGTGQGAWRDEGVDRGEQERISSGPPVGGSVSGR